MQMCPKQDRCAHGLNCPRDYFPSTGYLCFENCQRKMYKKDFHENYCSRDERRAFHKKYSKSRSEHHAKIL